MQYAFPVLAFGLGILMTFLIRQRFRNRTNRIHWRQLGVLAEILLLTLVAFLPQQANLLANSLISLACGFQVEAFRKIHGNAIATTMCIGNLRAGIHAAAEFGFSGSGGPQPGHHLFYGDSGLCPGGGFGEPGHCPVGDLGHSGQQRPSAGLLWPDVFPGKGRGRSWHSLSSTT